MIYNGCMVGDNKKILLIDDNDLLRQYTKEFLENRNFVIIEAHNGTSALDILKSTGIDLVLLDLCLGDMDGMTILKLIRSQDCEVPVIIISSDNSIETRVKGFEYGGNDYLTKPFHQEELLARIIRLLNRMSLERGMIQKDSILEVITAGIFKVNLLTRQCFRNNEPLPIQNKLFDLFLFLVRHENEIVSRERLYEYVWNGPSEINPNTLSVHIHMLRSIIEDDPKNPQYLFTIKGRGYQFSIKKG